MHGSTSFGSVWYDDEHFGKTTYLRDFEDLKKVDAVVLWGGEDISPRLYNQPSVWAEAHDYPSRRDVYELAFAREAIRLGLPLIGVCRGAQLLCAVAGGSLWQHVENHAGKDHTILFKGKIGTTNSAHHQMMRPPQDADVLAYTQGSLSPVKYSDKKEGVEHTEPEPEIVHFPKINAIGVQGHPEWLSNNHFLNQVVKEVLKDKLNLNVGY